MCWKSHLNELITDVLPFQMLSAINTWWEILRGSFQKHNLFVQKVWAYFTAIIYDIFTKETVQNLPYTVSSVFVLQTRSENNLKKNKLNYEEKFESKRLYACMFLLLRMVFFKERHNFMGFSFKIPFFDTLPGF